MVLYLALAILTDVHRALRLAFGPANLCKLQRLILIAVRTRYPIVTLVTICEGGFNPTAAGDFRGRNHEYLAPGECACSCQRPVYRVALPVDVAGIGVYLIAKQISRRHGAKTHGTVGAGHHQNATREFFCEHRISRVAGPRVAH